MGSFGLGLLHGLGQGFAAKAEREHELEKTREQEEYRMRLQDESARRTAQVQEAKALEAATRKKATLVSSQRDVASNIISQNPLLGEGEEGLTDAGKRSLRDTIVGDIFGVDGKRNSAFDTDAKVNAHISKNIDRYLGKGYIDRYNNTKATEASQDAYDDFAAFANSSGRSIPSYITGPESFGFSGNPNSKWSVKSSADVGKDPTKIRMAANAIHKESHLNDNYISESFAMLVATQGLSMLPVHENPDDKSSPIIGNILVTVANDPSVDGVRNTIMRSYFNPEAYVTLPSNKAGETPEKGESISSKLQNRGARMSPVRGDPNRYTEPPVVDSVEEAVEVLGSQMISIEAGNAAADRQAEQVTQDKRAAVEAPGEPVEYTPKKPGGPPLRSAVEELPGETFEEFVNTYEVPASVSTPAVEAVAVKKPISAAQIFEEYGKKSLEVKKTDYYHELGPKGRKEISQGLKGAALGLSNIWKIGINNNRAPLQNLMGATGEAKDLLTTITSYGNVPFRLLGGGLDDATIDKWWDASDRQRVQADYATLVENFLTYLKPLVDAGRIPASFYDDAKKAMGENPQTATAYLTSVRRMEDHLKHTVMQLHVDLALSRGEDLEWATSEMAAFYTRLLAGNDEDYQKAIYADVRELVKIDMNKPGSFFVDRTRQ